MEKEKSIVITDVAWKCLKALEEAIASMPEGDQKERAKAALNYLLALFKEETLPSISCPGGGLVIG